MKFFFVFLTLLPLFAGSASGNQAERPYLRWQDYNYKFTNNNVNRCVNKAFKYLVVNGFDEDADSSVNKNGTYGYAYGWTSNLQLSATIICDSGTSESMLILTFSGKAFSENDSLWKKLKSGKW